MAVYCRLRERDCRYTVPLWAREWQRSSDDKDCVSGEVQDQNAYGIEYQSILEGFHENSRLQVEELINEHKIR